MKIYVTAPAGLRIQGYGSRAYGESFELPDSLAAELSQREGFSLQNPIVEAVAAAADDAAVKGSRNKVTVEDKPDA